MAARMPAFWRGRGVSAHGLDLIMSRRSARSERCLLSAGLSIEHRGEYRAQPTSRLGIS